MSKLYILVAWPLGLALILIADSLYAQSLSNELAPLDGEVLYAAAERDGSAVRGAIAFHGPWLGCGKCHSVSDSGPERLGPNLARPLTNRTGRHLVDSILKPSAVIDAQYQAVQVLTEAGELLSGLVLRDTSDRITLRTADTLQDIVIARADIAERRTSSVSLMPDRLVDGLATEADFLDLVKYVIEIQSGGAERARELQPSAAQLSIQLPDYESHIDHAGFIGGWDDASLARGEAIYMGLCVNCHGTIDAPGSLATALRFGQGKFKFGTDPYAMYQTLTRGAGLMLPQPWMVPQQKYDVIHYIREHFLRRHNRAEWNEISEAYLSRLPPGDERGPQPQQIEPWSQADYGPRMIATIEVGGGGRNIAHKGIALQLDDSPGGVGQGKAWVIFDHDTLRVAGMWTSRDFIDWQGINFNGRHGIHPHVVGDIMLANPTGPGWAEPSTGSIADDRRVLGRDGRQYGPLPKHWAQYRGLYQRGPRSVIAYRVGTSEVLESFDWSPQSAMTSLPAGDFTDGFFARHLQIGPREQDLQVVVATRESGQAWRIEDELTTAVPERPGQSLANWDRFQGDHYFECEVDRDFDLRSSDFSIRARVTVGGDGTILASAPRNGPWAPGGQTLFLRDGRLAYDVGWVGVVQSNRKLDDGLPHDIGLTFNADLGLTRLWIDGQPAGKKRLRPEEPLEDNILRIGFTSENFPDPSLLRDSTIHRLQWFAGELQAAELSNWEHEHGLVADWNLSAPRQVTSDTIVESLDSEALADGTGLGHDAVRIDRGDKAAGPLWSGFESSGGSVEWLERDDHLMLAIAAGAAPVQLSVWHTTASESTTSAIVRQAAQQAFAHERVDQQLPVTPSEPLFPNEITTTPQLGGEGKGGFAVDELQLPKLNPWNARMRLTGLDFFADPDRLAVCTWDGDVWLVSGLQRLQETGGQLAWRRIAFGLFQPLGLKIIDETIYLTCRDQLVRLDDRNQDGEIDYYHCVNNDHQVTEHFHEFAMGLQTDAAGNFYYAKSARHALPAVVPHHGTLLRISPDGRDTDILAYGFRAANGVSLNPDGTFIVTDQEGHWNPKNRINYVAPGGFYGNMFGYHDVTDTSNAAMQQPLCWITNAFDRSPAELLWCDSSAWGPLTGHLLSLSYGNGKVFVVPHEKISGQVQGGMCELPIADFPTGLIRGRFSPHDGQLYICGLSAWATNQTQEEGGLYRIRYTGQPAALPIELSAHEAELRIAFTEALSQETSRDPAHYSVRVWSLKRTEQYGSEHYDERVLVIKGVELSADRRQIRLEVPGLQPTWCMEIQLPVVTADGRSELRRIHNTIHQLRQ